MKLSAFHYDLPEGRIAQQPLTPRDASRLLVLSADGSPPRHRRFFELDQILRPTDVLVTNATRVFPARLRGRKKTGGKAELLLLAPHAEEGGRAWRALVRGALKPVELVFPERVTAAMTRRLAEGEWVVQFSLDDVRGFLERHGEMPLPPYIKRGAAELADRERYQTVFARAEGAVAAPTAGFHFTPELLTRLKEKDVQHVEIVLHVGWGTFRPVRTESIEEHHMLPESFSLTKDAAERLTRARQEGRRIVAVGTTVVRTLETAIQADGTITSGTSESALFIYPGYAFKAVDALITNFHLPDSTPLLLANAFYAHLSRKLLPDPFVLRSAYECAIAEGYRFYSYGDAMLIQ